MDARKYLLMTNEEKCAYADEKIRSSLPQLRLTFFLCGVLYGLFAILDLMVAGKYLSLFLFVRFGIVVPMTLVYLAWSFYPSFIKLAGRLTFVLVVTGGVGIALMLIVHPNNFSYYGGLFLVIFTGYFLAKQETSCAIMGGAVTVGFFLLGSMIYNGSLTLDSLLVGVFFIGANVIGAFGTHQLEQIGRSHFMQNREIARKNLLLQERVREQRTELNQIEKAIESTKDAILICNPQGEITYFNHAYEAFVQPFFIGEGPSLHPFKDIFSHVMKGLTWVGERTLTSEAGVVLVLLIQADAVREESGQVTGIVTTFRDISERKDSEEKMRFLSFHDTLTGLYNRAWFDEELRRLDRNQLFPLSLIMADLNGLKLVNDTYGHAVGDRFLQQSADILRQACRGEDIVARWGGDEFVVLLPNTSPRQAALISDRIAHSFQHSVFEGIPISVALGLACKEEQDEPVALILQTAEDRMYKQKLTESRSHKSAVLNALRNTLQEKSFETDTHAGNMKEAAHFIGEQLGLSLDEMSRLDLVIQLHDIGKINMPGELLRKNGPLTPAEWDMMRQHPEIGYRIARATDDVAHVAEEILSHHERWDRTGYPRCLRATKIPLLARITTLVDAYEVMRNGRPYKKPMSDEEIRQELRIHAGKQFDPDLVDVFLEWQGWSLGL